jgi:hypothetical protein
MNLLCQKNVYQYWEVKRDTQDTVVVEGLQATLEGFSQSRLQTLNYSTILS